MGDKRRQSSMQPQQADNSHSGEFEQVLEALPQEQRDKIEQIMISQFAMVSRSSPEAEIAKQVTGEHISKMLENQSKAMDLTYKDERQKKILFAIVIILLLVAVFGVIFLLKEIPETMERVLTVIITAIISGLGGYGIGKSKVKDD